MENDDCCMVGSVNNNGAYIVGKKKEGVEPKEISGFRISEAIKLVQKLKNFAKEIEEEQKKHD